MRKRHVHSVMWLGYWNCVRWCRVCGAVSSNDRTWRKPRFASGYLSQLELYTRSGKP